MMEDFFRYLYFDVLGISPLLANLKLLHFVKVQTSCVVRDRVSKKSNYPSVAQEAKISSRFPFFRKWVFQEGSVLDSPSAERRAETPPVECHLVHPRVSAFLRC